MNQSRAAVSVHVRDVQTADFPLLLAWNEAEVPHVNSVPSALFEWFAEDAAYFRVACIDDEPAGFLTGLQPGLPHTSTYYRWFGSHYADFLYIDRIVVAPTHRQAGVASALYRDIAGFGQDRTTMLACEVNLRPRNDPSLAFHQRMGFRSIGTLETEGGAKVVSLLVKPLGE